MKARVCPECNKHNSPIAWRCIDCGETLSSHYEPNKKEAQTRNSGFVLIIVLFNVLYWLFSQNDSEFEGILFLLLLVVSSSLYKKEIQEGFLMETSICPNCEHRNPNPVWKCAACGEAIKWEITSMLGFLESITRIMLVVLLFIAMSFSPIVFIVAIAAFWIMTRLNPFWEQYLAQLFLKE